MTPVSKLFLSLVALVSFFLLAGGTIVGMSVGGSPLQITPLLGVVFVFLAALILWAGGHVLRYRKKKRTWVDSLTALRIAVAARACALVASFFTGALAGIMAASLTRVFAAAMAANALAAGLSAIAACVWCICGVIVERWCTIDPDDPDDRREQHEPTVSPA